jgi:acetate kinase
MRKVFLVLNTGSSTIKFQVFGFEPEMPVIVRGVVSDIKDFPYVVVTGDDKSIRHKINLPVKSTHEEIIKFIFELIKKSEKKLDMVAVGHRVVHGGSLFKEPVLLNEKILGELQGLSSLAPFHQPQNLRAVEVIDRLQPGILQIACFDTSYHLGHEPLFTNYALPKALTDQGVRRYGFHGLSYEWIAHVLNSDYPELSDAKVIVAHLGSGASVCAMKAGKSIDTTAGMTTLGGLPMGTRCGDMDPGVVIHMLSGLVYSTDEVEHLLYQESGLKGLSGLSGDVRVLLDEKTPETKFALDYFVLKVAQHIAMMVVSLGGLEALVFTGGIGENQPEIREKIISRLSYLEPFETLIIPANEEYITATHTRKILQEKTACQNH